MPHPDPSARALADQLTGTDTLQNGSLSPGHYDRTCHARLLEVALGTSLNLRQARDTLMGALGAVEAELIRHAEPCA